MKRVLRGIGIVLFFIVLWLFGGIAYGQTVLPTGATNQMTYQRGGYAADSLLAIPYRDTTASVWTSFRLGGRLTVRPADSQFYYHNGQKWTAITGTGGTTYTAGYGLTLTGTEFKTDTTVIVSKAFLTSRLSFYYTKTQIDSIITASGWITPSVLHDSLNTKVTKGGDSPADTLFIGTLNGKPVKIFSDNGNYIVIDEYHSLTVVGDTVGHVVLQSNRQTTDGQQVAHFEVIDARDTVLGRLRWVKTNDFGRDGYWVFSTGQGTTQIDRFKITPDGVTVIGTATFEGRIKSNILPRGTGSYNFVVRNEDDSFHYSYTTPDSLLLPVYDSLFTKAPQYYNINDYAIDSAGAGNRLLRIIGIDTTDMYGGGGLILPGSDSMPVMAKGDQSQQLHFHLSTDGGATNTYIGTPIVKAGQAWHSANIMEGKQYMKDADSVHVIYKGYNGSLYQMGHASVHRSQVGDMSAWIDDPANPIITDAQTETDLGFAIGDMGPADVVVYKDSIYLIGGIQKVSTGHYSICLWTGIDERHMHARRVIVTPIQKYQSAFGGTIFMDIDSNWYVIYTQGTTANAQTWCLASMWGRSPYQLNYMPGRFLEKDQSNPWLSRTVYGANMNKKWDGSNFIFPEDKYGYWQFYVSGRVELKTDSARTAWIKVYPREYDIDSFYRKGQHFDKAIMSNANAMNQTSIINNTGFYWGYFAGANSPTTTNPYIGVGVSPTSSSVAGFGYSLSTNVAGFWNRFYSNNNFAFSMQTDGSFLWTDAANGNLAASLTKAGIFKSAVNDASTRDSLGFINNGIVERGSASDFVATMLTGTANYIQKSTGTGTIGNSLFYETGGKTLYNSTSSNANGGGLQLHDNITLSNPSNGNNAYSTLSQTKNRASTILGTSIIASSAVDEQMVKTTGDIASFYRQDFVDGHTWHGNISGAIGATSLETDNVQMQLTTGNSLIVHGSIKGQFDDAAADSFLHRVNGVIKSTAASNYTLYSEFTDSISAHRDSIEAHNARLLALEGAPPGSASWGGITGTLSDQTDLQNALDDKLDIPTPITGATKTKITYGADGLITAGADATTADIAPSTDRNYVTDAQQTIIGNTSGTNTGDQTSVSGNAGTATALQTARAIYGNNFDGTAALTQIIASTYGGTGNGFTKFSGATTTEKTYTLPDISAAILTDNAAVTVAQGGTGLQTLTANNLMIGNGTSTPNFLAPSTSGKMVVSNGTTFVMSTPTFPNASATTGKIIKSDGTNWVASTETYAAPGTSGNAMLSDGTNWTSGKLPEVIGVAISDETTAITTGTAKVTIRMPFAMTVTAVRASVNTVSSSGLPTVDINEGGTTILSTKLTIDANEKTSVTAATAPVISDASLADDAEITFDIDVAGTGAKGLKVWIIGTR